MNTESVRCVDCEYHIPTESPKLGKCNVERYPSGVYGCLVFWCCTTYKPRTKSIWIQRTP